MNFNRHRQVSSFLRQRFRTLTPPQLDKSKLLETVAISGYDFDIKLSL